MSNYVITTDSTTDFPVGYADKLGVEILPLSYEINGEKHKDMSTTPEETKKFYDLMRSGLMPTTSQVNPEESKELFEKYLKEGRSVVHIAFSSGLSGTYNSAVIAAKELNETYKEVKVYVVDTKMASMGEGLMVHYAAEKKNEGLGAKELFEWLEDNKQTFCAYFTVDDLNHLHRGGRVSKLTAILGSMLSIKPCLHMDESGKLIPVDKVRGRKASLDWLVEKMGSRGSEMENDTVFLSHSDCIDDVEYVKNEIRKKYKIKNFEIGNVGPVIGSHSGPGTVALFFRVKNRTKK